MGLFYLVLIFLEYDGLPIMENFWIKIQYLSKGKGAICRGTGTGLPGVSDLMQEKMGEIQ